jgi:deoxycytidylate deaminase
MPYTIADLTLDERQELLEKCLALSEKSDCNRIKFGAIIVRSYFENSGIDTALVIVGEGYNHKASLCTGFVNCCALREKLNILPRFRAELCEAVHAEWAAIADAVNKGIHPRDAEIVVCGKYPSGKPYIKSWKNFSCTLCARLMRTFGIARVWVPCKTENGVDLLPLTSEEALITSLQIALGTTKAE